MTLTTYDNLEQRSPRWYEVRCGIVTASAMDALITVAAPDAQLVECPTCEATIGEPCLSAASKTPKPIKTMHGERTAAASSLPPTYVPATGDTATALLMALAAERITNYVEDTYVNRDMERGIIAEPFAREIYAEHCTDQPVDECGFMVRDFGGFRIGYSPDGLVGDDGLLEIKAPRQKRHLATILDGEVPANHMAQLQTGLLVSGREWIDFVSYSGGMHLWPKRVFPDPAWQAAILAAAERAEEQIRTFVAAHAERTKGLPLTERIDFDMEVVI